MSRVRWYTCIEEYWYTTLDAPYGYPLPPLRITQTFKDVHENLLLFKELPFYEQEPVVYEDDIEFYKDFYFYEALVTAYQDDYLKKGYMNRRFASLPFHIENEQLALEQITFYCSQYHEPEEYEFNPFLEILNYYPLYEVLYGIFPHSSSRQDPLEAFQNRQLFEQLPFHEEYQQVGPTTFIQDITNYSA
ncbi:hypothetical protein FIBSPDRAFT_954363 [Athelia psychrophila]|uniref:Uncharacterized protein n=1 Tax=Athelia psychrophila TaxID=1759441 RepID=A0A166JAQ5_9AGAM|nr:hypothetical protein FIBSPDRAFT_954363 [Fibularhizoctonia sp. CBS 109695]